MSIHEFDPSKRNPLQDMTIIPGTGKVPSESYTPLPISLITPPTTGEDYLGFKKGSYAENFMLTGRTLSEVTDIADIPNRRIYGLRLPHRDDRGSLKIGGEFAAHALNNSLERLGGSPDLLVSRSMRHLGKWNTAYRLSRLITEDVRATITDILIEDVPTIEAIVEQAAKKNSPHNERAFVDGFLNLHCLATLAQTEIIRGKISPRDLAV